jgi:hypothetical protein
LETTGGVELLEVELDDKKRLFCIYYIFTINDLQLEEAGVGSTKKATGPWPLIVTPKLNSRSLEFCRERRLSVIDLNGRVYLRAPGLLVDRGPLPGRNYRFGVEPATIFVGKSARIVRALLAQPGRIWAQRELVERTKASPSLASRIVRHLVSLDYLEDKGKKRFCVPEERRLQLLDHWAKEDDFGRRTRTHCYSGLGAPLELALKLKALLAEHSIAVAFTQWVAGWLRHPYTEPAIVSAYVPGPLQDALLETIGLRHVKEGGKVWLLVPDDEGVFLETQEAQGLPLVTDAQIYLDMIHSEAFRAQDQAKALREWEGFCRV